MYLRLTITDVPGLWGDTSRAVGPYAQVTRGYWYRLPADWFTGGTLRPERRRQLVDGLYRPGWRRLDRPGPGYVVVELREQVLTAGEVARRPWLTDLAGCYAWSAPDEVRPTVPAAL